LVGCAGAERPANPAGADLRQSLAPLDTAGAMQVAALAGATPAPPQSASGTITLVTPPQSRQAVVRAREAMQKKQWAMLETLVPIAKSDPVLGTYAEYWMLRQKLQDSTQPVPDQEMQRFMQAHPDGYLADRLRGDWLVAATRAGNYALAARLGPLVNSNSQETCSLL